MSPRLQAKASFDTAKGNPVAIKALRDARDALHASIIAGTAVMITGSTVNGQGFTAAKPENSPSDRLIIMNMALQMIEHGQSAPARTVGRFL